MCGSTEAGYSDVRPIVVGIWERFSGKQAKRQKFYYQSKKRLNEENEKLQDTVKAQKQELQIATHARELVEKDARIAVLEAKLEIASCRSYPPTPAVPTKILVSSLPQVHPKPHFPINLLF